MSDTGSQNAFFCPRLLLFYFFLLIFDRVLPFGVNPPVLWLHRFVLNAPLASPGFPSHRLEFPNVSPVIILGGNGSGKTLFVRMLEYLLSGERESGKAFSSEFESAELGVTLGQESYVITADFTAGEREVRRVGEVTPEALGPVSGDGENSDHFGGFPFSSRRLNAAVMRQTFLVVDGDVRVRFDPELTQSLATLALSPLSARRTSAQTMLRRLNAPPEEDGLLYKAQMDLTHAEEQVTRFIQVQQQIERNAAERRSLETQVHRSTDKLRRLQEEHDHLMRRQGIEQQINLLKNWLDEVTRDRAAVEELRTQHVDLLSRFEESHRPFRGAPETLGEQLAEMVALQERLRTLSTQIAELDEERGQKESDLATVREKRSHLEMERQRHLASAIVHNRKLEEINRQLRDLRHARLGLEEKREVKRRLLQDELRDESASETELLEKSRRLFELYEARRQSLAQQKQHEERWLALQEEERVQARSCEMEFPGFDRLPPDPENLLRKLHKTRDDLKNTEQHMVKARQRLGEFYRHPRLAPTAVVAVVMALIGLAAGLVIADWAVGLFLALLVSGSFLLVFGKRLAFPRGIKRPLEAELGALKLQWKRVLDAKAELDDHLQPLSGYSDLTSGLKALHDCRAQNQKLQAIRDELADCEAEASATPSLDLIEIEIAALTESLPQRLRALEPERLAQSLETCRHLQDEVQLIETRLKEYDPQGEKSLEIAHLEAKLSAAETAMSERHRENHQREEEIGELCRLEKQLQADLASNAHSPLLREKEESQRRLDELQRGWATTLEGQDASLLWEQWQQVINLRAELRAVRDRLSSLPTLDELHSREQVLKAELSPLQGELAKVAGELPSSLNLEDLTGEMSVCEAEIKRMEQERDALPISLEELGVETGGSPESLSAKVEECRQAIERLETERDELEQTITQTDTEISQRQERFTDEILAETTDLLERLTAGRIRGVLWESEGRLGIREASGRRLPVESLSGGLSDLVMFALRLAMVGKMEPPGPPLVLDDPFTRLDPEHLARLRDVLSDFSENHQVILLTRDPRYGAWSHTISLTSLPSRETGTSGKPASAGDISSMS
jgi:DNA repair exonuclease SbcCD ATPase subunit